MSAPESQEWKKVTEEQVLEFQHKQHAVKRWIENILDIELESEDLSQPLRNGVILCYLMRRLDKSLIPRIQEETDQMFKLRENVEFFVAACEDMGVPPYQLFKGPDLYNGRSIVNVVEGLAALAKLVQEQFEEAPALELDPEPGWKPPALTAEEKNNLKKLLSKVKTKRVQGKHVKMSAAIVRKKLELMAGNGVDVNKYVPGFKRFQSVLRGHQQRQKYIKMVRNVAYRDHVAHEILETERGYVTSLGNCINVWLKPLNEMANAGKPLISKEDIRAIFSDISVIHQFNTALLETLTERVAQWHTFACMGDLFLRIIDFFKVYTQYVQNFNTAMAALERVSKKKAVVTYFNKCKDHPECGKLDLPSFLIMPVQRIPRYNLLLSDLVRHTWPEHPDHKNLALATERIQDVAAYINEKKREAEDVSTTIAVSRRITGKNFKINIAEPHRRFVREGFFNAGSKEELVIYIFNDMIVVAKPGKKLLADKANTKYKDSFKLTVLEAREVPKIPNTFELLKQGTDKVVLRATAASKQEMDDFLNDFNTYKKDAADAKKSKPGAKRLGDQGTKVTVEQRLRGEVGDLEQQMGALKSRQAAIVSQISELEEFLNTQDKKKRKKQTKQQRKEAEEKLVQLTEELDELNADIGQMEARAKKSRTSQLIRKQTTLAPGEGGSKDATPRNSIGPASARSPSGASEQHKQQLPSSLSSPSTSASTSSSTSTPSSSIISNASDAPSTITTISASTNTTEAEGNNSTNNENTDEVTSSGSIAAVGAGTRLSRKEEKERKKKEKLDAKKKKQEEKRQKRASKLPGFRLSKKPAKKEEANNADSSDQEDDSAAAVASQDSLTAEKAQQAESENETTKKEGGESEDSKATSEATKAEAATAATETEGSSSAVGPDGQKYYTLVELRKRPPGLDHSKLESYLSPEEFQQTFGCSLEEFYALPQWKQKQFKNQQTIL
ncbi:RhoGEF domain containing protein [Balamuthia mandrillaris]